MRMLYHWAIRLLLQCLVSLLQSVERDPLTLTPHKHGFLILSLHLHLQSCSKCSLVFWFPAANQVYTVTIHTDRVGWRGFIRFSFRNFNLFQLTLKSSPSFKLCVPPWQWYSRKHLLEKLKELEMGLPSVLLSQWASLLEVPHLPGFPIR